MFRTLPVVGPDQKTRGVGTRENSCKMLKQISVVSELEFRGEKIGEDKNKFYDSCGF